uniref:Uncharacterized protein n=1 Tax=Guillardia theta TaxID=55529 RepID=A0A7S4NYH2_GUITH|mmetsp:Transcript_37471/g.118153  ORF Transcript_37471/g.118153 Transcript_37471/m.118153 type:complete len:297 (+) Transcript_37471:469-1359(+)
MLVQLGLKLDAPTRIKGYSRTTKKFYMAATAFKMPPKVLFVKISPTSNKAESTILLEKKDKNSADSKELVGYDSWRHILAMHTDSDATGNILVMGIRVDNIKSSKDKPRKQRTIFIAQLSKDGKIVESDDIPLNPRHVPVAFTVLKSGKIRIVTGTKLMIDLTCRDPNNPVDTKKSFDLIVGSVIAKKNVTKKAPKFMDPNSGKIYRDGHGKKFAPLPMNPEVFKRLVPLPKGWMPFKASDWKDTKKKAQKALQRDNPTAPPKGVSLARASKFRGGELSTVLYLHEEYAPQRLLSA